MGRFRAAVSVLAVAGLLALAHWFALHGGKVEPPADRTELFPGRCKFAFRIEPQRLLTVLPAGVSERLGPRGRVLAESSAVVGAATEDFGEVYLLVKGSPPVEELAASAGEGMRRTEIGGLDALAGDGACLVMLGEREFFAVFAREAARIALARLTGSEKEKRRLSKNLKKRLEGVGEDVIAGFCGFPGPLTPPLVPGEGARLLQEQTKFLALDVKRLKDGNVFVRLNLYFPSEAARDLVAMTLPGMLVQAAADYPFLEEMARRVRYHRGSKSNLRIELVFPPALLEPVFNPPPPPSPLIPDVPEFPF